MGIVRDVTIDQLTQAVQGISTNGISDSTGQAINNTLGTLGKDTSLQGIIIAINSLAGAISPAASNVTFDNTDTSLNASNAQIAIEEVNEKADIALQISKGSTSAYWGTTASITRNTQLKSMVIIGGRLNKGFLVFIPAETNEYIILSNINSCITNVTVTANTIDITLATSGYGSAVVINTIVLI